MFEEFTDSEPLRIYPTKGEPIEQPPPMPVYSGSGRVTDCRGNGISDATVTLGGSAMAVTTTDAAGNYAFAGLPAGGGYNLSPSKADQYLRFSTEGQTLTATRPSTSP